MIDVQIIPATEEHLQMILPDVRQADIDELYAVSLMTTEDALRVGLRTATMAWSGFANGELVTMFGVSPASMIGANAYLKNLSADQIMPLIGDPRLPDEVNREQSISRIRDNAQWVTNSDETGLTQDAKTAPLRCGCEKRLGICRARCLPFQHEF
jgi:hypothetical protein